MLTRLIAHQIRKEEHKTKAAPEFRAAVLPVNTPVAEDLFKQLREAFLQKNPVAGAFLNTGGTKPRFQQLLENYITVDDDAAFVSFTREATQVLSDEMAGQQAAKGGYVVFAEFRADDTKFLFAALLGKTEKPNFDEKMNLVASPLIDLEHLRHGARIRFDKLQGNENGVALFISQQSSGASDYFIKFIGCEAATNRDAQAKNLYTALDDWAKANKLSDDQRTELFQRAYSHWQDCRRNGRPMTLTGIANELHPEAPDKLSKHLGKESHNLDGEFPTPSPSVMKRFVKFAFNKGGLKLEFDRAIWVNKVSINQKSKTVTIANVPEDLIVALAEELEN